MQAIFSKFLQVAQITEIKKSKDLEHINRYGLK